MDSLDRFSSHFDASAFVSQLLNEYETNPEECRLSGDCAAHCTGQSGEVLPARFDAIAIALAQGYQDSRLSFGFCDAVVNAMVCYVYADSVAQRGTWPSLFWDVFLAFDSGEFFRNGEPDIDPAEKYTRPQIAAILADRNM